MKLYFKILLTSLTAIIGVNLACSYISNKPVGEMMLYLLFAICICGFSSAIIMLLTRILPKGVFSPYRKRFRNFEKESRLYQRINVKKWKDKVPELGRLTGFAKNTLSQPNDMEYMYRFLIENCIAESVHGFSILSGLLLFVFIPLKYLWTITFPIFILNTLLHILPVIIQRYLRPKMLKIYNRLKRNENKDENLESVNI